MSVFCRKAVSKGVLFPTALDPLRHDMGDKILVFHHLIFFMMDDDKAKISIE